MDELDVLALAGRFGIHPVMLVIPIIIIEFLKRQWSWLRNQIADRYAMALCQILVWGQGLIEYAPPLLHDMALWTAGGFILWLTTAKGIYKHMLKRFGLAGDEDAAPTEYQRRPSHNPSVSSDPPAAGSDPDSRGGAGGSGGSGGRFGYQSDY